MDSDSTTFQFIQNKQTGLDAGVYEAEITQTITNIGDDKKFQKNLTIVVSGKRLFLTDNDVHMVFPPDNSSEDFSDIIPFIVLNDNTMAWTRATDTSNNSQEVPFLFLLIVPEKDGLGTLTAHDKSLAPSVLPGESLQLKHLGSREQQAITLQNLQESSAEKDVLSGVKAEIDSTDNLANLFHFPGISKGPEENADQRVSFINIKKRYLTDNLPTYTELACLAHNRELKDGDSNSISKQRTVILSNKVMGRGDNTGKYRVYVISLEARFKDKKFDYQGADDDDYIGFTCLRSWRFEHKYAGETLLQKVENLDQDVFGKRFAGLLTSLKKNSNINGLTIKYDKGIWSVTSDSMQADKRTIGISGGSQNKTLVVALDDANAPATVSVDGKEIADPEAAVLVGMLKTAMTDADFKGHPTKHALRQGGHSFSWYHGPLLPEKNELSPVDYSGLKIRVSDELIVFDESNAMFDVSYAAAWQLGRMLCLQDSDYVTKLSEWRINHGESQHVRDHDALYAHLFKKEEDVSGTDIVVNKNVQIGLDDKVIGLLKVKKILTPTNRLVPGVDFRGEVEKLNLPTAKTNRIVEKLEEINIWTPDAFLEELCLLEHIPSHYLLPQESLLPDESIRFFHLDWFWIECLLDGVLSIGKTLANEKGGKALSNEDVRDISGILIRSKLVSDFPDLKIDATDKATDSNEDIADADKLEILREARISDDILLVLFKDCVKVLDIYLTPDGLHYKISHDTQIRSKAGNEGQPIWVDGDFVKDDQMTLDLGKIKTGIENKLSSEFSESDGFSSAQLAMQLIIGNQKPRIYVNQQ